MDKFLKYAPLLLLLGIALGFVLGFQTFVMPYMIEPIAIFLWAGWRIIASVDQNVYWVLLIVVCSILMIRVLVHAGSSPVAPADTHKHEPRPRLERWQELFRDAARTREGAAALRESLGGLLVSVIAQTAQSAPANLEEALAASQVSLPPAVRRYFGGAAVRGKWLSRDRRRYLVTRAQEWLRRWMGKAASSDNIAIQELLQWMESAMEVHHDR